MAKYTKTEEKIIIQEAGLDAKEIEAIADFDGRWSYADRETYIAKVIVPKYPNYKISVVHEEDARESFRGWKPLSINYSKNEVKEEKNFEDAERWKSKSLLCWRDRRIQDMKDRELQDKQNQHNKFTNLEDTKAQASRLNEEVSSRMGGDISFKPLGNN